MKEIQIEKKMLYSGFFFVKSIEETKSCLLSGKKDRH